MHVSVCFQNKEDWKLGYLDQTWCPGFTWKPGKNQFLFGQESFDKA